MRPHHLAITNVGPFVGEIAVDFDDLGGEGLFLIHGRTGSGKTFLLDAMTYALFGEIPEGRANATLLSHHAPKGSRPSVVLEFTAAGNRYRAERWPAHPRRKLKGEGFTEERTGLHLVRIADDGTQVDVPGDDADHDAVIRAAVGLDARQFRRVILLPQGEFARFLKAGDGDREAILTTLFDTLRYHEMSERLRRDASVAVSAVAERARDVEALGIQARDRWNEFVEALGADAGLEAITDDTLTAATFADLVARIAEAVTTADRALKDAQEAQKQADDQHQKARDGAALWRRRNAADAEQEAIRRVADAMAADATRLAEHQRALPVRAPAEALGKAEAARADLDRSTADVLERLQSTSAAVAGRSAGIAALDLSALPPTEALEPLPVVLANTVTTLEALADDLERAAGLEQAVGQHRAEIARLAEEGDTAATERGTLIEQRSDLQTRLEEARTAAGRLEAAEGHRSAAEAAVKAHEALALAQADLERLAEEAKRLNGAAKIDADALTALRLRRLAGLSATIAATLVAGESCPVCGSHEHPAPAQPADDDVTDDEIAAAEATADESRTAADAVSQKVAEATGRIEPLTTAVGDGTSEGAARALEDADTAIRAAKEARTAVDALQRRLGEINDQLEAIDNAEQERAGKITEARTLAEKDGTAARELQEKVRSTLGDDADPAGAIRQMQAVATAVDTALAHRRRLDEADLMVRERSNSLADALATAGFTDPDAALAALLPDDAAKKLARTLDEHSKRVDANQRDLDELATLAVPDAEPDTEATATAAVDAKAATEKATREHDRADKASAAITGLRDRHTELDAELAGEQERAAVLERVAQMCTGQLTGKARLSLQRWVLGRHLDEICAQANVRLAAMTAGRYRLARKTSGEPGNQLAGLGLEIFDEYSDQARDVTTLSGGESFQTSLALALGLADVVQDRAGGRRLEALFVDEGFGTLDEETLHVCMNELESLREGGRLVGMVSHVKEVKERIRYGVEVVKGRNGSTVRIGPTHDA